MSSESEDVLQTVLDTIATVAGKVAPLVPGPGSAILAIASTAFSSAAALQRAGKDPVKEIERIHAADPVVAEVREAWKDELDRRWPKPEGT